MSFVVKTIIAGWSATFAMFAIFALRDSGKLLRLRRQLASWIEPSRTPMAGVPQAVLQSGRQD